MRKYLLEDPWKVIEEGFDPDNQQKSESIFSLGNGHMGMRANFEETFSGQSLQGTYIAGIFYPDKTRVGWWKNGYPEYFAKMLNAPSWTGFDIRINGKTLDLNQMKVLQFKRTLDMKRGTLTREFSAGWDAEDSIDVSVTRFVSMARREIGAVEYRISSLSHPIRIEGESFLEGDVYNQDSNYGERFWENFETSDEGDFVLLSAKTKKSGFTVSYGMTTRISTSPVDNHSEVFKNRDASHIGQRFKIDVQPGETITLTKIVAITTSRDYDPTQLKNNTVTLLSEAASAGFTRLLEEHVAGWEEKWKDSDIIITGDTGAQQGIRFNIFQLNQTYTGHDPRLNIGPKGFTGEKYGGSTYWDTEAFCLPFYLGTSKPEVARNLLLYRYNHLAKAIENAARLGFSGGAALFPMVTVDGTECHNEWEITFEEIHRNGAIAHAIYNYIRHTGDRDYLAANGLEVLIGISRFWSQRFTFSDVKQKFVLLGVTGPNEYENNVNNNWYTNYIAAWTLFNTMEGIIWVKENKPEHYKSIIEKTGFVPGQEIPRWETIIDTVYLPESPELGIFLQQEGYLDKEQKLASDLKPEDRPLNQKWSWDRILRSCFIKQADVLQGFYFFGDHFDLETLRRNFEFYEPRTVHESSLSASIHSVLAARLGYTEKAYELYLRTSRLDLDDYNHEVDQGCHITSMAGTWIAIVEGFAGMSIREDTLCFNPILPDGWSEVSFSIHFRQSLLKITYNSSSIHIREHAGPETKVRIGGETFRVFEGREITVQL
jgi:maltose phosphorylase